MAAPIRSSRKHSFFIKITISQYHDIDISYIDIDIGENAFSMTSLGGGTDHILYIIYAQICLLPLKVTIIHIKYTVKQLPLLS